MIRKQFAVLLVVAGLGTLGGWLLAAEPAAKPKAKPAATSPAKPGQDQPLEYARKTVRMLDDLYKTAVVLITEHYVEEDSDLAAGSAAIALFDQMKQKGWHEVRLLDATGKPIDEENSPRDEFERAAVQSITGGETYVEEVVERDGKRYLRAATNIPVVLQKCTMCHEHYKQAAPGAAIGALSYTLPIE